MGNLTIERLGGLGGLGLPGSRITSRGTQALADLPPADQAAVEELFRTKGANLPNSPVRDGFRYRITRNTPNGPETVEVPESVVPAKLQSSVKDELE